MWSTSSSKHGSSYSSSSHGTTGSTPQQHRRSNTQQSDASGSGGRGGTGIARQSIHDEDAWKLDESDDEEQEAKSRNSDIAKVAAQAGLGRNGSATTLGLQAPPRAASASQTSLSSTISNGSSSNRVTSLSNTSIVSSKSPPPSAGFKERGRQSSYGFWDRISGFGASKAGDKEREREDGLAESSGYARFDNDLELEDNFDGTYSINTAATGSSNSQGLLAPASISRALSSGKLVESQLPPSATSAKGKSRSTDGSNSIASATIVGTPRTRSPLGRSRKGERPSNDAEMRRHVRSDLHDVMQDPVNLLKGLSLSSRLPELVEPSSSAASSLSKPTDYYNPNETPPLPSSSTLTYDSPLADHDADAASAAASLAKSQAQARRDASRKEKFVECLSKDTVDIAELRKHAWAGIPTEVRPIAWQLLLGYLPAVSSRRVSVLARKRQEYADAVKQAFDRGEASLDAGLWHQIKIDVPRTNPGVPLWQYESTQRSLEKILYVWAIRHPASGYVQGINDLATPFYQVFLSSYIDCDPEDYDISALPPEALSALEADTFWCLSKLLDGIQDNYIYAQPGIHRQVARCQELCARVDAPLAKHLESEGVSFLQFSFRWFHLLFLRVLPVNSVIRMWDTYMSEGSDAFANFHTYVCLAFLLRWSEKLRSMDFQAIMLFLQEPVDHEAWSESSTELLLSEAYMWSALWSGSKKTK